MRKWILVCPPVLGSENESSTGGRKSAVAQIISVMSIEWEQDIVELMLFAG